MNAQEIWKKEDITKQNAKQEVLIRRGAHTKYEVYSLNTYKFKNQLSKKTIQLPTPNGSLSKFTVKETSTFSKELSAKFPNIKSYTAKGIDDSTAVAKISIGNDGVHVMISSGKHSTFYIDPYTKNRTSYIAYKRSDLNKTSNFECKVEDHISENETSHQHKHQHKPNDGLLRTYRLALVCSGEYAQFHLNQQDIPSTDSEANKKAAVLSAMNTSVSRLNGVFERDLSVRLEIVANNESVIFLDAANDGITDGSPAVMINQVQQICDNVIGSANYDIGHIFSIGGDGYAGFGVVCVNGRKARGVTGRDQPIGDAYDIDFVAHEMGHQFGASHTQNNDCNRYGSTAVEPGSASTIMGYAGICSPNVQANSDDYFHSVSITQMLNYIATTSCASTTNINNTAPTANAGNDYTIPKSTPFVLKGTATDSDGNSSLTYNWEQTDYEIASMPPLSTNSRGPMFRSLPSSTSSKRYMPSLSNVVTGTNNRWEVLPSVARSMNFSFLVRDNKAGGGQTARDNMKVTVSGTSGPFAVTSQNTSGVWVTGTNQVITWDVASTDQAPFNVQNVTIKLSTDGGVTFPIILANETPNDGSHTITVPNNPTSNARIMIEANNNIFYNVNKANFIINSTGAAFILKNTSSIQTSCNTGNKSASFNLNVDFINGFDKTVTFSATNAPSGAKVTFSPSSVSGDANVTMIVSNYNNANIQDYIIIATGTSSSLTQTADANLKLIDTNFSNINLTSPTDGLTDVGLIPILTWGEDSNASSYEIQIATDNTFSDVIYKATSATNSHAITKVLEIATEYYWSVKPTNNCGEGEFSNIFNFTTGTPIYCSSTFTNSSNSEWISNVTLNTINNNSANDHSNVGGDGYEDFTSISTTLKAGDTYPVSVTYKANSGTYHCSVFIDWNRDYVFDSNTEKYDLGIGGSRTATKNITVPNNVTKGDIRMRVIIEKNTATGPCDSNHTSELGETEDYTITINELPVVKTYPFNNFKLYPNPSNGIFNLYFEVIEKNIVSVRLIDIRGRIINSNEYNNVDKTFSTQLNYNNITPGVYLLQIQNGNKQTTKKIIVK